MQFHGGVYRSDDAGETGPTSATGLPSDFGFPLVVDPADPDSAYVIPLDGRHGPRRRPAGRVRVYETRDAGATWTPRGDGLPAEHAYLTVLRQAFDRARRRASARALLRRDLGRGLRLGRRGRHLVDGRDAPPAGLLGARRLKDVVSGAGRAPPQRPLQPYAFKVMGMFLILPLMICFSIANVA